MGKKTDLTPRKLSAIKTLLREKIYSQRAIAIKLGVSASPVNRVQRKIDFGQDLTAQRKERCGAKPLFTPRSKRILIRHCISNRRATSKDLAEKMNDAGVMTSASTVRCVLVKAGLNARRQVGKVRLTPTMIKKRLLWARRDADWTDEHWSKVCFSDESSISILQESSQFVRRRTGEN